MKVSEVKALAPLADIYEFKPDAKYIMIVNPADMDIESLAYDDGFLGPEMIILACEDPASLRFFELAKRDGPGE